MTFREHLRALRKALLPCFLLFMAAFVYCFVYGDSILEYVLGMGSEVFGYHFVYLSPQDMITESIKISGIIAISLTVPYSLVRLIMFFAEELTWKKKFAVFFGALLVLFMFVSGIGLGGYFLYPYIMRFLCEFGQNMADCAITAENFIGFTLSLFVSFGCILEIPVVCYVLGKFGILKSRYMTKFASVVIVFIFIISAIITPPDVVSQIGVAVPMIALYYISILIVKITERGKKGEVDT